MPEHMSQPAIQWYTNSNSLSHQTSTFQARQNHSNLAGTACDNFYTHTHLLFLSKLKMKHTLTALASFSSLSEALSSEAASSSMLESPPRIASTSGDSEPLTEKGTMLSGGFCQLASRPAASELELSRDRLLRVDIAALSTR